MPLNDRLIVETLPRQTFAAFLDEHNLTVKVTERDPVDIAYCVQQHRSNAAQIRFMAHLQRVDIIEDGGMSFGAFGDGATVDDAVRAVAEAVSGRTIRVWTDSYKIKDSVKFRAPIIEEDAPNA